MIVFFFAVAAFGAGDSIVISSTGLVIIFVVT